MIIKNEFDIINQGLLIMRSEEVILNLIKSNKTLDEIESITG